MSLNNPYSGANLLAEWQATGTPWLTQSSIPSSTTVGYSFATAAKSFRVYNHDSVRSLKVGFTLNGVVGSHYTLVPTSGSLELDARFSQLWLSGSSGQQFSLFVALTGIPTMNFGVLTGSNGFNLG